LLVPRCEDIHCADLRDIVAANVRRDKLPVQLGTLSRELLSHVSLNEMRVPSNLVCLDIDPRVRFRFFLSNFPVGPHWRLGCGATENGIQAFSEWREIRHSPRFHQHLLEAK